MSTTIANAPVKELTELLRTLARPHFGVVFTNHARAVMSREGISLGDVLSTLQRPDDVTFDPSRLRTTVFRSSDQHHDFGVAARKAKEPDTVLVVTTFKDKIW